ncbi:MAG TPA: short-chain dehydrogenase/reductase [Spirochaetaceae bacterium]|jgi:NAD(P)-dependent dehydrogenase (short-subunit alcohol dehydrogenase family)|nr:short-chain dehydrogenase/reductase [Spirochaetaceae bacterium]
MVAYMGEHTNLRKVAFVTGATSGLGLAIARSLAEAGYLVYGGGRRPAPSDLPANFTYVQTDVTSDESVRKSMDYVLSMAGRVDLLVCAAGFGISGAIEDIPMEEAASQFDVNFFGVVRVVQALLPTMRRQKGGRIIIIGSIAGKTGMPFQAYYSASKFALEGFVESLRYEVSAFNIEACIVEPGDFRTGFTGSRKKIVPDGSAYRDKYKKVIAVQEHDETHGMDPLVAGRRIVRLASARRLPVRITVGPLFERFAVWVRRILPDGWFEAFYRIYYKL